MLIYRNLPYKFVIMKKLKEKMQHLFTLFYIEHNKNKIFLNLLTIFDIQLIQLSEIMKNNLS